MHVNSSSCQARRAAYNHAFRNALLWLKQKNTFLAGGAVACGSPPRRVKGVLVIGVSSRVQSIFINLVSRIFSHIS